VGLDAVKELSVLGFHGHGRLVYAHVYRISATTGDLRNKAAAAFGLADLARLTIGGLGSTLEQDQPRRATTSSAQIASTGLCTSSPYH
jgi:hypothetical protein